MTDTVHQLPAEDTVDRLLRQGRITQDEVGAAREIQAAYAHDIPSKVYVAWISGQRYAWIINTPRLNRLSRLHLVMDILIRGEPIRTTEWHYRMQDGAALRHLKVALMDWRAVAAMDGQRWGVGG